MFSQTIQQTNQIVEWLDVYIYGQHNRLYKRTIQRIPENIVSKWFHGRSKSKIHKRKILFCFVQLLLKTQNCPSIDFQNKLGQVTTWHILPKDLVLEADKVSINQVINSFKLQRYLNSKIINLRYWWMQHRNFNTYI